MELSRVEYEVVFKELFVPMNGAAKKFATSWILKLIYYFIAKEKLMSMLVTSEYQILNMYPRGIHNQFKK